MQQGGATQKEQVMQIIQMYAEITGEDPQAIMQELQGMSPQEQSQAIQQIQQAVQSAMSEQQGQGEQMQQSEMSQMDPMQAMPPMRKGGSYSGTYDAGSGSYFNYGGSYGRMPMAQTGYQIPSRPMLQDYPDYSSYQADDAGWLATYGDQAMDYSNDQWNQNQMMSSNLGYTNPAATVLASGSPMAPIAVPTAAVSSMSNTASKENPADYGYSIVNYLNTKGYPSSYSFRKDVAKVLNIPNYTRQDGQNIQMLQTLINNPTLLNTLIESAGVKGKGSNSTAKAIKNIRKKAEAQGAIPRTSSGSGSAASVVNQPVITMDNIGKPTMINVDSTGRPVLDSNRVAIDTPTIFNTPNLFGFFNTPNLFGFRDTGKVVDPTGGRIPIPIPKQKENPTAIGQFGDTINMIGALGIGLGALVGYGTASERVGKLKKLIKENPNFNQMSDNLKNQVLEKATADIEATYKWYKTLPKEQQAILENLDAMEIAGYYTGEDIGDPSARAEAMFGNDEADLERRLESQFRSQEAEAMNAEADLENRLYSQYADQEAEAMNAIAAEEQAVANAIALRNSGATPRRAVKMANTDAQTQAMLDEAALEEAYYNQFEQQKQQMNTQGRSVSKVGPKKSGPSFAERLKAGMKNNRAVNRPGQEPRVEGRVEGRPVSRMPSSEVMYQNLGKAGNFLKGLFREVGKVKKQYGGSMSSYVPDYTNNAYAPSYYGGGMYKEGGGRALVNSYNNGGSYNNPGFRALPKTVQLNIKGQTPQAMYGMGMQQGGVVEVNESELPQVLQQLKQGGYQFEIMR
jgi:hypothetical protein